MKSTRIEGLGRIIALPFDEALDSEVWRERLITPRDFAYVMMQQVLRGTWYDKGSYTRAAILYYPRKNPLLALNSPLLDRKIAKEALEQSRTNRAGFDGGLYEKFFKMAEKDRNKNPKKRNVLMLPKEKGCIEILKGRERYKNILEGIFKDLSEDYLNLTRNKSLSLLLLNPYRLRVANVGKTTLVIQLFMDAGPEYTLYGNTASMRGEYYYQSATLVKSFQRK